MEIEKLIKLLGKSPDYKKMEEYLTQIEEYAPILKKGEDSAWVESNKYELEMAFEDESIISGDKYADIGDGDLIFMTVFCNDMTKIELPYGIKPQDGYNEIALKIGKKENRNNNGLKRVYWMFKRDDGLEYILSFSFKEKEYQNIKRFGIIYSYGQLPWVEELKKNA